MIELSGKTVWITGASSGIGRALVIEAAKLGANVVLSARSVAQLKKIQAEAGLSGHNSLILPLDLKKYHALAPLTPRILKKFPAIDILVNNGGISQRSLAADTKLAVYEDLMAVNYFGNIALALAVLPGMRARKSGTIVTISSVAGKIGTPLRTGYSASKFATNGFYDALRAETYKDNIQVTVAMPGFVNTNVSLNALKGDGKKQGIMDAAQAAGISAEECASRIWNGVLKKKNEFYIAGAKERLGVIVQKFFPGLFAKIIRKAKVT
jgi:dehydrogenase/reductase SDR family member 7B